MNRNKKLIIYSDTIEDSVRMTRFFSNNSIHNLIIYKLPIQYSDLKSTQSRQIVEELISKAINKFDVSGIFFISNKCTKSFMKSIENKFKLQTQKVFI